MVSGLRSGWGGGGGWGCGGGVRAAPRTSNSLAEVGRKRDREGEWAKGAIGRT